LKLISKASKLSGTIDIPGSKSHTIRALAVATMANGKSVLRKPLFSGDTYSAIKAAEAFGAKVSIVEEDIIIEGIGKNELPNNLFIDVGNSGTTLRIFTALAAISDKPVTFDGDNSVRQRLMTPLFSALRNLGAKIESNKDKCPFTVTGPIKGGNTNVEGISSQFLTALLFTTPLIEGDSELTVLNLHEKPYVSITLDWLNKQNIEFENKGLNWFKVKGGQAFTPFDSRIAADFSSATFALCAAAITRSELLITGLDFNDYQGDKAVFDFLSEMGMQITHTDKGVLVNGTQLKGVDLDINDTPDALPALAVAACFAEGTTRLLNVPQARLKECDRISAICTELKKMGANIEELKDGLIIQHSELKGAEVHGYDDHRMVMALAIAGMGASGTTTIDTAESVSITYPSFYNDMKALGAQLNLKEK
jgi:3-phosphoshikimate 1-carboxyvinyltransferase